MFSPQNFNTVIAAIYVHIDGFLDQSIQSSNSSQIVPKVMNCTNFNKVLCDET